MLHRLSLSLLVFLCLTIMGCGETDNDSEAVLFINEFLAANSTCCVDESSEYDDWLELYNPSSESVDLGGYFLTDDLSAPQKFQIADGIIIEPGGFLLFWADGDTEAGALHCDLQISAEGEELGLYTPEGDLVDTVSFGEQSTDISYGRYPDGDGEWQFLGVPTPGGSNLVDGNPWDGTDGDPSDGTDGNPSGEDALPHFSFFVTSLASLQQLSGSEDGFGGDLRYGETGPGAGLRGADKICEEIAEMSMPGSSVKEWRAFLSVTADENGNPVNAIDRIGEGPWYDRIGRMLVPTKADLLNARPENGDIAIRDDLPNEWGIPNHQPDPNLPEVDNHHMLTGSDENGVLYSTSATCQDWTTDDGAAANGEPRCGLSWPRTVGGGRPGGGGGGTGGTHWISALSAPGCAPGIELEQNGGAAPGDISVGAGGGYGGFYCFALTP